MEITKEEFLNKHIKKIKNFEQFSLPTDTTVTLDFLEYKKLVEMVLEKEKNN
jgi:hypothetical protein